MNDFFRNIRTDFNFIFGQFSVARKLILNGGAIRPTGLLLSNMLCRCDWPMCVVYYLISHRIIYTCISRSISRFGTIKYNRRKFFIFGVNYISVRMLIR